MVASDSRVASDPRGKQLEVVMFASAISSDVYLKGEGYLAHRWGLTGNLLNDHPYKSVEPTV
jgi:hypothetical protein